MNGLGNKDLEVLLGLNYLKLSHVHTNTNINYKLIIHYVHNFSNYKFSLHELSDITLQICTANVLKKYQNQTFGLSGAISCCSISTKLHCVTARKTIIFIFTATRTLTSCIFICNLYVCYVLHLYKYHISYL
jgi:hypothetical protein